MGRILRLLAGLVGAVAAVIMLVSAAWAVDSARTNGAVGRNVELAGHDVSNQEQHELAAVLDQVADVIESAPIEVRTADGAIELDAEQAGLRVDRAATINAALAIGDSGNLALRPLRWAASFLQARRSPVVVTVDASALGPLIVQHDPTARVEPVEPGLQVAEDGSLEIVPPEPGRGLDPGLVAAAIVEAARAGRAPLVVSAEAVTLPPRFTVADAEPLLARAEAIADRAVAVRAGDGEAEVTGEWASRHLALVRADDRLTLGFAGTVMDGLAELLPDAGTPPVDAGFTVSGGSVRIVEGRRGTVCCAPEASDLLLAALERGGQSVQLPLRTGEPDRTSAEAAALGVVEEVATFTTNHACCESRVTNIHRIADIVRGAVIEPGQSFSLNEFVGKRTRAKGFVDAGVIYNGRFQSDVGGGISQFVTTFFNAAFFAGLEFEEYQSHSIYISRYPYGREATISYPKPDFRIRNNTPHGVLVWPTYTGSSITISLWSTKVVDVEQTGQRRSSQGRCTRVTTERTRRWSDGRTEVDNVFAVYRPGEGINC